jgi:spore coat protein CotH
MTVRIVTEIQDEGRKEAQNGALEATELQKKVPEDLKNHGNMKSRVPAGQEAPGEAPGRGMKISGEQGEMQSQDLKVLED